MQQLTLWHSTNMAHAFHLGPAANTVMALSTAAGERAAFLGLQDLTAAALWLSAQLRQPVALTLTRNRSTMVSYRCTAHGVRLRLHRIFVHASLKQFEALVKYVQGDRAAGRLLDRFLRKYAPPAKRRLPFSLCAIGTVFDLNDIFNEVNVASFHGACNAKITWGSSTKLAAKGAGLRLGLYLPENQLICVHPCLDQTFVPRFYVAWVIYQQMLCELFGVAATAGRRIPPELPLVLSCHPDYERARAWEPENMPKLRKFKRSSHRNHGSLRAPP